MQSPNLVDANIVKIAELFPNCITEDRDENGIIRKAVDFDELRQELSASLVEGPRERYTLSWPGKNEAILTANAPIAKTLRPCEEESVDFENTKNLYIEGDNLDVLKLLQEIYLNMVVMMYIDQPYNTGNDFIYEDDFAEDTRSFLIRSNQKDEAGNRLVANTDSNGRFHSDWLSMMYPRLKLARNLLKDKGLIFISIDDNEVHNLRKICDEIFGEDNFVAQFLWKKKSTTSNVKDAQVSAQVDYQICYRKTELAKIKQRIKSKESRAYPNHDEEGLYRTSVIEKKDSGSYKRDTMKFEILGEKPRPGKRWQIGETTARELEKKGRFFFDGEKIQLKIYDFEDGDTFSAQPNFLDNCGSSDAASRFVNEEIFGVSELFDNPKPVELVKHFISLVPEPNALVLDFFSGSATTAHATMQLNAEDGGTRKFIMVQLPEPCDEKSEAFKAGYKTIAEIGKERIRRAGKKIKEENPLNTQNLDIGFRVFKVDTSNMKDVYYTPDELKQGNLELFKDHIKPDRRPEDLLFQVFLDWGLDLALPIAKETIDGKTVFFVDNNVLMACFDSGITEELVKKLAKRKPMRAVFRDDAFGSDSVKINVEQIFKLLSPGTEVKSI